MAIKKNVYSYDIKYDSKADAELMKIINSKSNNNSSKSNDLSSNDVENYPFDMEYTVSSGETLTEIASKYGLTYQELADYNNIADPNYIEVGQVINIPAINEEETDQSKGVEYQVIEGDNLTKIAEKYGLTYQELADYNNIADPNYIEVGQVINIPVNDEIAKTLKDLIAEAIKNGAKEINNQTKNLAIKLNEINQKNSETAKNLLDIISKEITDSLKGAGDTASEIIKEVTEKYEQEKVATAKKEIEETLKDLIAKAIKNGSRSVNNQVENLAIKLNEINQNNKELAKQILNEAIIEAKTTFLNAGYTDPSLINNITSLIVNAFNTINEANKFSEYTIQSGDTLSAIAAKYGISLDKLIEANNISDPNNINVGQTLKIPASVKTPKMKRQVTRDIDLSKIVKDSVIGKAIEKYSDEIKEAFKVKIDESEMITITETEIDGNTCLLTHIIITDPSKINGEPANGEYGTGVEKTSSAAKRKTATLMINGSNFIEGSGTQDLRNTNHIAIVNGKIVHDGKSEGMEICLDKNGRLFTPTPGTTAADLINQGVIYSFASLDSRLIWNGEKDYISQPAPGDDNAYNSTVIGMTEPGEYYILTGSTTNVGAREFLYDKGCTYAKSMDQGGSVTLVFKGEVVNNPTDKAGERSVGDFLYFT